MDYHRATGLFAEHIQYRWIYIKWDMCTAWVVFHTFTHVSLILIERHSTNWQFTIGVDRGSFCLPCFRLYARLCSNEQGSHNHHDAVYVSETDMYSTTSTTTTTTFLTTLVEKVIRRRESDTAIKSFYVTSCP